MRFEGERKAQREEALRACFDDEVDDTRQQSHAAPEKVNVPSYSLDSDSKMIDLKP